MGWGDEEGTWTSNVGQRRSSQDIIYSPGIHCRVQGGTLMMIIIIPVLKDEPDNREVHFLFQINYETLLNKNYYTQSIGLCVILLILFLKDIVYFNSKI